MTLQVVPDIADFAPDAASSVAGSDDDGLITTARLDEMFEVFSSNDATRLPPDRLFLHLDAAITPRAAARELDALLKVVAEATARARHEVVADLLHGIVTREAALEDDAMRRQYGIILRRAAVPPILRSLTLLLPRNRERHDVYMTVLARCEDAGAEALAEALIAAPSIGDRRVYYDALIRMRSGIRTVMHMLGDTRWFVARNAAELLGELKVTEAEAELTPLLEHADDRVRSAAAVALARIGSSRRGRGRLSRTPVPAAAPDDAGNGNGQGNGHGNGHAAGPGSRSVHSLIKALEKEADSRVQVALIAALGQLGTQQAVDKLVEIARTERGLLARQRPTPLRVAAVHALGQARAANAQPALQALLRDKSAAIRGAASWVILGRREPVAV
jgi:HEAT repeat protein